MIIPSLTSRFVGMVCRPFEDNLWFFVIIWILSSSAAGYYWLVAFDIRAMIDMALGGMVISYFLCCFVNCFHGKLLSIGRGILVSLGIINLCVDKAVYNICHMPFNMDTVGLIYGTNLSESAEFLSSYVNFRIVVFILLVLCFCLFLFVVRRVFQSVHHRMISLFLLLCMVISLPYHLIIRKVDETYLNMLDWRSVSVAKVILFLNYERPVDLCLFRKEIDVAFNKDEQIPLILLVIGESVSRDHCSIYGYEKETTPYSEALFKDGSLIAFTNVKSAFYSTEVSIRMMLSTCSDKDDNDYMYRTTVFDLLSSVGYSTVWISNQSSAGLVDNIVATYAKLADDAIWVGTQGMGLQKYDFDELLLEPLDNTIESMDSPMFSIVHMMGCHEAFSRRYPLSWCKFDDSDYSSYPVSQRKRLSEYDNALLYSDYVMSELFNVINDKDAIGIYVPDHGLDLYQTDSGHCAHAKSGDIESINVSRNIPFYVFCPEKFKKNHHEILEYLLSIKDEQFDTSNLIDFLATVCGIYDYDR